MVWPYISSLLSVSDTFLPPLYVADHLNMLNIGGECSTDTGNQPEIALVTTLSIIML